MPDGFARRIEHLFALPTQFYSIIMSQTFAPSVPVIDGMGIAGTILTAPFPIRSQAVQSPLSALYPEKETELEFWTEGKLFR